MHFMERGFSKFIPKPYEIFSKTICALIGGNQNAQVAWQPTYPTLAGYNGSQTFGLRVDSARIADRAGSAPADGGNADTVDGLHINGGRNTEGNKLVRTNGSGYIDVGYINSNNGVENGNIANMIYDNGDGYYRKCSIAHLISKINAGGGGGIVGSSLAQNGWVKFANGLILQWGRLSVNGLNVYQVTYPIAFAECYNVSNNYQAADGYTGVMGEACHDYFRNVTASGFIAKADNGAKYIHWRAIGR